jgi:osmoprotectant transport system ATP-binding protein
LRGALVIMLAMFGFVGVSKSYSGNRALHDVTFDIQRGQNTVIIGPSGCGKSTIFGLMTGLLKPNQGSITFQDEPLNNARLPSIRRRLGYVVQDGGLFPHLTCMSNISLVARHIGWSSKKVEARVEELTAFTRLSSNLLTRYPVELSGGERQRVSLMRALMLDPDVLLLDEPLAALDPMVRAALQEDLTNIFRRLSKTVVLVTHDLKEAEFFADQIILMRAGRIVQTGMIEDLVKRPAEQFVSQFVRAQQQRAPVRDF